MRVLTVRDTLTPPPSMTEIIVEGGGSADKVQQDRLHAAERLTRKAAEAV